MAHLNISPTELDIGDAVIDGTKFVRVLARDPETGDSAAIIFTEDAIRQIVPQLTALIDA